MKQVAILISLFFIGLMSADAANLVQNPTFDADIAGWTPVTNGGGTVAWASGVGNPAGSIATTAASANMSALATQCIAISAPVNVDYLVDGFADNSSGSGSRQISATSFAGAGCTGANLGDLPAGDISFPGTGWNGFQISTFNAALPATTQSVLLTIGSATGATTGIENYHFDNVRFGPTGTTPVRLQSFNVD